MSNQKHIYDTVNQILNVIDQINTGFTPESKAASIKRKFVEKGEGLYEVNLHEKTYVVAKSFEEARKCADLLADFGDMAGVLTDVEIKKVHSADDISGLVSKDKAPVVPVIGDNGGSFSPCLYTLNELLSEMFPTKEKSELEQKIDEARAKVQAASQEYYKLYEQFKGTK
jgi:hypothetical protein